MFEKDVSKSLLSLYQTVYGLCPWQRSRILRGCGGNQLHHLCTEGMFQSYEIFQRWEQMGIG